MSAAIFNSGTVKILKDILKFKSGNQITQAGAINPTAISTAGMPGDLYISASTGAVYKKLDSGSSVNWKELLDSATVAAIVASYIPLSQKGAANGVVPLDGGMKIDVAYLPSSLLIYKGQWNAATNTPTLADATGTSGWVYEVIVAGTQNLGSGAQTFKIGDWVVHDGTKWDISTNSNEVVSVNGMTGAVNLTTTSITEGTSLYFTDERAQDAVGAALAATATVGLVYNDAANQITANVVAGSITNTQLAAGIDAAKIGDGSVSTAEFQFINSLTSNAQTQIDARANTTLSNVVAPTALAVDLLPNVSLTGASLGSSLKRWKDIWCQAFVTNATKLAMVGGAVNLDTAPALPSGASAIGAVNQDGIGSTLGIYTDSSTTNSAIASSNIAIETGNRTVAGTGNSGAITLQTGTSFGGARGKVILDGLSIDVSSKNIVNVATPILATDGANKSYIDSAISTINSVPNFITNGNAESGTTGWTVNSFGSASRPAGALNGATSGITFSASSAVPLAGTNSFILSKSVGGFQGRVVYTGITITPAYFAKVLQVSADYLVSSGTFTAGSSTTDSDVIFYLQNVTDGTFIEPSSFKLLSNSTTIADKFSATFQTTAAATSYRLLIYVASAAVSPYSLKFDNISVSPSVYVYGTPITDWQSYTPIITAVTTNPTKASSTTEVARFRRVGDSIEIQYNLFQNIAGGTAGSGIYRFSIPPGLTIDSSKVSINTDPNVSKVGTAEAYSGALTKSLVGTVFAATTTQLSVALLNDTSAFASASSSFVSLSEVNLTYNFTASVPILGFSSSVQMSDDASTRIVAVQMGGAAVGTAAQTPIIFPTVANDTHGAYNTTTGRYLVSVPGYYRVTLYALGGTIAAGQFAYVSVNAAGPAGTNSPRLGNTVNANDPLIGTGMVFAKSGDFIDIRPNVIYGAINAVSTASIERISGPSAIAATESVNAVYKTSAGQSIPNGITTIINFDTKEEDSHGSVTTGASWKFQPSIGGLYEFSGMLFLHQGGGWSIGEEAAVVVHKGVTEVGRIGEYIAQATHSTYVPIPLSSRMIRVNAGEAADVRLYHNSGAALALLNSALHNWISIKRVGN